MITRAGIPMVRIAEISMIPHPANAEIDRGLIFDVIEAPHTIGWFQPEYGEIRAYDGKNKNKTTQKDPYEISKGNQPFDISTIEEAPDWVKSRK